MSHRSFPGALALAAWSLLVWTTRIRNIWTDDELTSGEQLARTALALSFTVLALAVGYAALRQRSWRRAIVLTLAGWTLAVWGVRSIGIATADHDPAFIAVHLVLAVVSIVLAVLAVREQAAAQVTTRSG
jgi:succinate-acetate transporter protein